MKTLTAILALSAVTAFGQPIDYRFDQVKRTVTLTTGTQELNVAAGTHAQSGTKVTTGWFSYALIATEQYRAKFEIFASTQVQLAEGTPGVLLSVDRGRIRAMFDKITGSEPRVVKTPGAMLAVRGTQFDVDVDSDGRTTVDVFEGVVEVRSDLLHEPLLVHPGEQSVYGRRDPPNVHPMPEDHRRNDPNRKPSQGGGDAHGMGPRGQDPHQPGQPPPARPPQPPPSNPPGGHH
jgi:ferric-dicitrate binding protein FerR (iron transport regulator)